MAKDDIYKAITECMAPPGSLLEKHGENRGYQDCHQLIVPQETPTTTKSFAKSFFASPAFGMERSILWALSFVDKPETSRSYSYGGRFFQLLEETKDGEEIILDSGSALTWMRVTPCTGTDCCCYQFGSIVKPHSILVRALIYPHQLYSKLLLAGAVRYHQKQLVKEEDSSTQRSNS